MNALNVFAILLGLWMMLADVVCDKSEHIDWKAEIENEHELFMKELETQNFHSLNHRILTNDFVMIMPDSIIDGDFEALEKFDKVKFNIDGYVKGPAHIVSACGNTAVMWRKHSFKDDKGVTRNGTFVALYVYQDGTAKIKLCQSTV